MGPLNNRGSFKETLILAFVLICGVIIVGDLGKNVVAESRSRSDQEAVSTRSSEPKAETEPTMSEEEMKAWTEEYLSEPHS